jgi:hypothetical protein
MASVRPTAKSNGDAFGETVESDLLSILVTPTVCLLPASSQFYASTADFICPRTARIDLNQKSFKTVHARSVALSVRLCRSIAFNLASSSASKRTIVRRWIESRSLDSNSRMPAARSANRSRFVLRNSRFFGERFVTGAPEWAKRATEETSPERYLNSSAARNFSPDRSVDLSGCPSAGRLKTSKIVDWPLSRVLFDSEHMINF